LRNRTIALIAVGTASFLLLLAGLAARKNEAQTAPKAGITKATAVLHPTEGNKVHGVVTFTREGDKVKVVADLEGLTPGKHGFHIHEWGDCSSKDGAAAGGHFNTAGMPHGAPADAKRHEGDLGNVEADQNGKAHVEFVDSVLKLEGPKQIIGRGVIAHASPDDLKTQPTGNAGGRLACGVIGVAKP
jgi:Cu-Zn family superoxide dismutase